MTPLRSVQAGCGCASTFNRQQVIAAAVQGELDCVSQTLTTRIRQLAYRYAAPLPQIVDEVKQLAAKVATHLEKMGVKA